MVVTEHGTSKGVEMSYPPVIADIQADNVTVETTCIDELNAKLCDKHINGLEIGSLVYMYGEVCDVLTEEIQHGKTNNYYDLLSHATFLILFEQFIALVVGRSLGPTPFVELMTVLFDIITKASIT
jgi:hypothetical protein